MAAVSIRTFSELSSQWPYTPELPDAEALDKRKLDAAHRILKAWRHSQAGIAFLQKDRDVLALLPFTQFEICLKKLAPVLRRGQGEGHENPERGQLVKNAVINFSEHREKIQKQKYIPVVTRLHGKGKLPDCQLMTPEAAAALDCHPFHDGSIYLTPAAILQYLTIAESAPPLTKKQVDALASALSRQKEILALDFPFDGCFPRSSIILDMLALSGMPLKNMCRQYVSIPSQFRADGAPKKWTFHVAPLIKSADDSLSMLDLILSPERSLTTQEWVDRQKRLPSSILPIGMVNLDFLFPETPLEFSYDHELQGLTFRTVRDIGVEFDPSKSILAAGRLTTEFHRNELKRLASYRITFEQYLLACIIPPCKDWAVPESLLDFLCKLPQEDDGVEIVDEAEDK